MFPRNSWSIFCLIQLLQFLGKEGYQTILPHGLQNANYMRAQLEKIDGCKVVCPSNHGPSVAFRLYPEPNGPISEVYLNENRAESLIRADEDKINQVSSYHRQHFTHRRGKGLKTNWVNSYYSHRL